jgi:hypothetical protein
MIPPPTIATSKSSTGASFRLAHVHGSKGYAPPAGLIYSPVLDPEECDVAVTEQIPLSKPTLGEEEVEAVRDVLASGWTAVQGPRGTRSRSVSPRSPTEHMRSP